jgi:streptomycin 6-kinase
MFSYPEQFVRTQTDLHGPDGLVWLDRLPAIVNDCARRWDLKLGHALEPLTYNYLVNARCTDGTAVIIKIASPTGEFQHQKAALEIIDGRGAVRLLASDDNDEVLLLEGCEPGTRLDELSDDKAITIAASIMRQLWRPLPPDHSFPTIDKWGQGFARLRRFYGGTGPFPEALVERAEHTFAEFSASADAPVLLHGDLHHDNILAAQRQSWLAIDPKGVAGEPAYETGAFLLNRSSEVRNVSHPGPILARRLDRLAGELEIDRRRVRDWGVAQAVLSAWWTVEDHGHPGEFALGCAAILAELPL